MQHARERLYFTADKGRLVAEGNAEAAFLYAAQGDEIPDSAAERFGIVEGKLKSAKKKADPPASLLGSSVLPAMVVITDQLSLQLGEIVHAAHKASGLSVDDWNGLQEADREAKLQEAVRRLREVAPKPKPATKPKKAAAEKEPPAKPKEQPAPDNKEEKATENKGG